MRPGRVVSKCFAQVMPLPSRLLCLAMACLLVLAPLRPAPACAPVYPFAVIVNWTHPDLPLRLFAAGNLGVIEPSWARSYLTIAYRYLDKKPLDKVEQESMLDLWHSRLKQATFGDYGVITDNLDAYLKLRNSILGVKGKPADKLYMAAYSYIDAKNIRADALATAKKTLAHRLKKWGKTNSNLKQWIEGQDTVFGIGPTKAGTLPAALPATTDPLLRADRQYQIAAATMYAGDFKKAAQLFDAIAKDGKSPWAPLAPYLVARCQTNEAIATGDTGAANRAATTTAALLAGEGNSGRRRDILALVGSLNNLRVPAGDLLAAVIPRILNGSDGEALGRDVGDLTYLMDVTAPDRIADDNAGSDRNIPSQKASDFGKNDLTDWLDTIQRPYDYWYCDSDEQKKLDAKNIERNKHALEKWRETKETHWLVAAMCLNGLRGTEMQEALSAADKLPSGSPAYLTAGFFIVDAMIAAGKRADARARLQALLAQAQLPPSARNLYSAQMLSACSAVDDYLHAAFMNLAGTCDNYVLLPNDWIAKETTVAYSTDYTALDSAVAEDLNRNLPLSSWVRLCNDRAVPGNLHKRVVLSTWIRAELLHRSDVADQLLSEVARSNPQLAGLVARIKSAPAGQAKQYAVARLILKTNGSSPYLAAGIPRHGTSLTQFDAYNDNFWVPLAPAKKEKKKQGDSTATAEDGDDEGETDYWAPIVQPGNNHYARLMQEYYQTGISRLLSAQQKAEAEKERQALWNNHPSKFLGEIVLAEAKTDPSDCDVQELLYRVVKLPKWKTTTAAGSAYSRKAYVVLHRQYPKSPWTAKAPCWY